MRAHSTCAGRNSFRPRGLEEIGTFVYRALCCGTFIISPKNFSLITMGAYNRASRCFLFSVHLRIRARQTRNRFCFPFPFSPHWTFSRSFPNRTKSSYEETCEMSVIFFGDYQIFFRSPRIFFRIPPCEILSCSAAIASRKGTAPNAILVQFSIRCPRASHSLDPAPLASSGFDIASEKM